MQLVRKFTTANAIPQPKVPWYEPAIAYILVVPGILTWFVGVPNYLAYVSCAGNDDPRCLSAALLDSSTGSYTGILVTATLLYLVAVGMAVTMQFTVRKLFFPFVWSFSLVSLVASAAAYLIMAGQLGTPWGQLLPGT